MTPVNRTLEGARAEARDRIGKVLEADGRVIAVFLENVVDFRMPGVPASDAPERPNMRGDTAAIPPGMAEILLTMRQIVLARELTVEELKAVTSGGTGKLRWSRWHDSLARFATDYVAPASS